MSRSTKKPYYTDQNSSKPNRGVQKKVANKAIRQAGKRVVRGIDSEEIKSGAAFKKAYCSYNIRDWSFHCPKDKKAYRK